MAKNVVNGKDSCGLHRTRRLTVHAMAIQPDGVLFFGVTQVLDGYGVVLTDPTTNTTWRGGPLMSCSVGQSVEIYKDMGMLFVRIRTST